MWETFSDLEKGSWHLGPNSLRGLSRGLRGLIPDASLWGLQCAVAWVVIFAHREPLASRNVGWSLSWARRGAYRRSSQTSVGFQVTALFLAECSCARPWGAAGVWLRVSRRAAAGLRGRGSVTTTRRTECAWTRVCAHIPLFGWHAGLPSGTDRVSSCRMLSRQRLFPPLEHNRGVP